MKNIAFSPATHWSSQTQTIAKPGRSVSCRAAQPTSTGQKQERHSRKSTKNEKPISWKCVEGCGACCKLDKGPSFPRPEDIFEDPNDISLFRSLVGSDGWCMHYNKGTRTCSIYNERPYFCRVEPEVFSKLYGIDERRFAREACGYACKDSIKNVYGKKSPELQRFKDAITNVNA